MLKDRFIHYKTWLTGEIITWGMTLCRWALDRRGSKGSWKMWETWDFLLKKKSRAITTRLKWVELSNRPDVLSVLTRRLGWKVAGLMSVVLVFNAHAAALYFYSLVCKRGALRSLNTAFIRQMAVLKWNCGSFITKSLSQFTFNVFR